MSTVDSGTVAPVVGNIQFGQGSPPFAPTPIVSGSGSITVQHPGPSVIWATAYSDMSSIAIHLSEIEALRYAVEHRMDVVKEVRPGVCLREQLA